MSEQFLYDLNYLLHSMEFTILTSRKYNANQTKQTNDMYRKLNLKIKWGIF